MDKVIHQYLAVSVFSLNYLKFMLTSFVIYLIAVCSIIKVIGEKRELLKVILAATVLALLMPIFRKFVPSPYNMMLFYMLTLFIIAFVFRLPLKKSFVGVAFSLLLTMLSSVTITMSLFIYTNIGIVVRDKFNVFLLVSLTEVTLKLIYVLLASRYENLNLSFLFSEEKNAKA
ncbi:MAG: hypothetical protein GX085_08810 [Firmicutes bacterium]|nr:hypothetical protein [Bacillota bacterium]